MTADVTREPTGGQGLRGAIANGLRRQVPGGLGAGYAIADAVLALPELAALIADAERGRELEATVARVRELAEEFTGRAAETNGWSITFRSKLRQALDGDQ